MQRKESEHKIKVRHYINKLGELDDNGRRNERNGADENFNLKC